MRDEFKALEGRQIAKGNRASCHELCSVAPLGLCWECGPGTRGWRPWLVTFAPGGVCVRAIRTVFRPHAAGYISRGLRPTRPWHTVIRFFPKLCGADRRNTGPGPEGAKVVSQGRKKISHEDIVILPLVLCLPPTPPMSVFLSRAGLDDGRRSKLLFVLTGATRIRRDSGAHGIYTEQAHSSSPASCDQSVCPSSAFHPVTLTHFAHSVTSIWHYSASVG